MTTHKTRKINIAYCLSKWWQRCETNSWRQTVHGFITRSV